MLSRCSASQNQVTTGAELCRVESVGLQSSKNSPSRDHIVGGGEHYIPELQENKTNPPRSYAYPYSRS